MTKNIYLISAILLLILAALNLMDSNLLPAVCLSALGLILLLFFAAEVKKAGKKK